MIKAKAKELKNLIDTARADVWHALALIYRATEYNEEKLLHEAQESLHSALRELDIAFKEAEVLLEMSRRKASERRGKGVK